MLPHIGTVILEAGDKYLPLLSPRIDHDPLFKRLPFGSDYQRIVLAPVLPNMCTCQMKSKVRIVPLDQIEVEPVTEVVTESFFLDTDIDKEVVEIGIFPPIKCLFQCGTSAYDIR